MREEKKNMHGAYAVLVIILLVIMALPYLNYLGMLHPIIYESKFYKNVCTGLSFLLYTAFYIVMIPMMTSLFFSPKIAKKLTPEKQKPFRNYYAIVSAILLIGIINHPVFYYYNCIAFPIITAIHLYIAAQGYSRLATELKDENNRLGFNNAPLEIMGLVYNVRDKDGNPQKLHINNVFQGIMVTGGAGSGKSASLIDPAIYQWIMMGCSATIYDFKGNPAVLGLNAYNTWLNLQKHPEKYYETNQRLLQEGRSELKIPRFELITFDELAKTSRPNPISPKTLQSILDTKSVATVFMKGLNKGFIKQEDFWAQAAFSMAHGIIERLRRHYPNYCTIPHMIVFGLQKTDLLMNWLAGDESPFEVQAILQSYITAITNNAEGQIGGMFSSFQQPITPLLDEALFWVLGAPVDQQSDLNLNDPQNPRIVSISNNDRKSAALSPVISCMLQVIMTNINEQNKHPHAFIIDEYPTLYVDISHLPATARSNRVSTLAAFQDKAQTESEYGKEVSQKLISNLGTQAYGMINLAENAKPVSDMIGKAKKVENSYSMSDDGINVSTRLSNEETVPVPDIMKQRKGHFTGKIADGEPAFFHCQFDYFDLKAHMEWHNEIDILNYPPTIMQVHKINPTIAKEMFNSLVQANFHRIITECGLILAGVIKAQK